MNSIKRTFWTAAGLLGLAAILALPAAADQQILDDLIVDGSACVGFDCVNGESFGFDTVRLKENNVRLHFSDTSTSASFPSNDWRIVANDTSNGGGNYLGFEDSTAGRMPFRVEAGAPSHSLYVEDGGRIGFGTSTPVVELHVRDGDSPTLRLEQDGSSGFTPQTWDVAGNEANFFVRDVTNGSKLSFKIKPGAPTDSMFIAADGDIGIGTASPSSRLNVRGGNVIIGDGTEDSTRNIRLANDEREWVMQNNGNSGQFAFRDATGGVNVFTIEAGAPADSLEIRTTGVFIEGGTPLPDFVFGPDYELESIAEHSAYMWENRHLPAVGAATVTENGRSKINLLDYSAGVLEELEKAHIYIEQLHNELKTLRTQVGSLEAKLSSE